MTDELPEYPLTAGIEIHQQLDTRTKLFCGCPTVLRETQDHSGEFCRYLRATVSELGEIDDAAREEMRHERRFRYFTYDTTCLVENDDEPPAPLNPEALTICLTIAKLLGMSPVPHIHTMRKLVIDGSNTPGFQRTALVAFDGTLPGGCRVETICLEEEAAQRIEETTFSLDRMGIPLVEITTSPDLHTPREVRQTAEYIGMVLRSTGKVKRGIGTIRQDINISIPGGARVEIKGVQELDLIEEVVKREMQRQTALIAIAGELHAKGASPAGNPVDVTPLFSGSGSRILKQASVVLAVLLPGFAGLVGREIQPGRRLGSEISDYARKCGVGGIFHTDELPAYGITAAEVSVLRDHLHAGDDDCVILVAGQAGKVSCAAQQVKRRAALAFQGVPEETRKMIEGGSTAYMRPLPGAARMYPETDVLPVEVSSPHWAAIPLPPLLSERAKSYSRDLGLDPAVARQIAYSERVPVFDEAIRAGIRPALAARTLLATLKEIGREGADISRLSGDDIIAVLTAVENGRIAKEAVPEVLTRISTGTSPADAVTACGNSFSESDLKALIHEIVASRTGFVHERGPSALGPLMGVVMERARGSVDGKRIAALLKEEIAKCLKGGAQAGKA